LVGSKGVSRVLAGAAAAVSLSAFSPVATAGADAEGMYSFKLVDPMTIDYCYAESGAGYRTTCARLQRQV
jgi:hypothetical protein